MMAWTTPKLALVAGLAALAGFAAVYAGLQGGRNDRPASVQPAAPVGGGSLRALATGDMATFVVSKKPARLKDFVFRDRAGTERTVAAWKGKVVLLNVWATWCAPCRKEMPDLAKLQRTLGGDQFEVVAISIDRGGPEKPAKFLNDITNGALAFYQGETRAVLGPLRVIGMPTTLLLDREGRELGRLAGPAHWGREDALRLIKFAIDAD